jgi:hypothetical protein
MQLSDRFREQIAMNLPPQLPSLRLRRQQWHPTPNATVTKETHLLSRLDGQIEPRYMIVNKGDKVAGRQSYQGWWFVMHAVQNGDRWDVDCGWLPRNILTDCHEKEGTP